MALPPTRNEIAGTPTNAEAKAGFGKLWDYVTGLLGATGDPAQARALIVPSIVDNGNATAITIDSSENVSFAQNVGIGTSSPSAKLDVSGGGDGLQMRLQRISDAGFVLSETTGNTNWRVKNSGGGLYFQYSATAYDSGYSTKVGIDSSGNLLVGTTSPTNNSRLAVAFGTGNDGIVTSVGASTGQTHIRFVNSNGAVGSISTSGSSTAYNTSSDYRLKHDIAPMTGALARVTALKPVTYKWNADGSDGEGFIAHELQEVIPGCVTGEKDAVEIVEIKDEEGNVIGTEERPIYQGIDTSFLAGLYAAALQELIAKNDALEARLAALENKA